MTKPKLLVLCTGNSARSQMAEGLFRRMLGGRFDVFGAGTKPTSVRPEAVTAMSEVGIDISGHRSKSVDVDYVITMCDNAKEMCPVFPADTERVHWSFEDPAAVPGTDAERARAFRLVRDQIATRIQEFTLLLQRRGLL